MNANLVFFIVQILSLLVAALIVYKYTDEQKDRRHVFAQLGHNGFKEHLFMGKILATFYVVGTLLIALSTGVFFLFLTSATL